MFSHSHILAHFRKLSEYRVLPLKSTFGDAAGRLMHTDWVGGFAEPVNEVGVFHYPLPLYMMAYSPANYHQPEYRTCDLKACGVHGPNEQTLSIHTTRYHIWTRTCLARSHGCLSSGGRSTHLRCVLANLWSFLFNYRPQSTA